MPEPRLSRVELMRRLDKEFLPGQLERFRSEVADRICNLAKLRLARNNAPIQHSRAGGELGRHLNEIGLEGAVEICRKLAAACPRYRFAIPEVTLLCVLCDTLRNRADVVADELIVKHAPNVIVSRDGEEIYDWSRMSSEQLQRIENDLTYRRLSPDQIDRAVFDIYVSAGWLFCDHLLVFGLKLTEHETWSPLTVIRKLDYDPAALRDFPEKIAQIANEFKRDEAESLLDGARPNAAKFGPVFVTAARAWSDFAACCDEHLGDWFSAAKVREPDQWKWLRESSDYVVAIGGNFLLNQASRVGEYWLRELAALTECLRLRRLRRIESDTRTPPAKCRLLPIPLRSCLADSRSPFTHAQPERIEHACAFEIGAAPFLDQEDTVAISPKALEAAFRHCVDVTPRHDALRAAVECFESACSLSGSRGTLSEDMQVLWSVASLWTTLEVLFEDTNAIRDSATRSLQRAGFSDKEIAKAVNEITILKDRRNDGVHGGRCRTSIDDVARYRRIVGAVLGAEFDRLTG